MIRFIKILTIFVFSLSFISCEKEKYHEFSGEWLGKIEYSGYINETVGAKRHFLQMKTET